MLQRDLITISTLTIVVEWKTLEQIFFAVASFCITYIVRYKAAEMRLPQKKRNLWRPVLYDEERSEKLSLQNEIHYWLAVTVIYQYLISFPFYCYDDRSSKIILSHDAKDWLIGIFPYIYGYSITKISSKE